MRGVSRLPLVILGLGLVAPGITYAAAEKPVYEFSTVGSGGIFSSGFVSDASGNLYTADVIEVANLGRQSQIVRFNPASNQLTPVVALPEDAGEDFDPPSLAYSPSGVLYGTNFYSSTGCGSIESYNLQAGQVTTLYTFPCGSTAAPLPNDGEPAGIIGFDSAGNAISALGTGLNGNGAGYFKFNPTTQVVSVIPSPDTISGGVLHPNGLIYTYVGEALPSLGDIFSVDPTSGQATDLGALPTSPDIANEYAKDHFQPAGFSGTLTVDSSGAIWGIGAEETYSKDAATDNACFVIIKFDPTSAAFTLEQHLKCSPLSIAAGKPVFDQSGALYFVESIGHTHQHPISEIVYKYDPATNTLTELQKLGWKRDGYQFGPAFVSAGGTFYGYSQIGAKYGDGGIFQLVP